MKAATRKARKWMHQTGVVLVEEPDLKLACPCMSRCMMQPAVVGFFNGHVCVEAGIV